MKKALIYIFGLITICSCSEDKKQSASGAVSTSKNIAQSNISLTNLNSDDTNVKFTNIINESPGRNGLSYDYMYNGGGVALADFDNDGLEDIFFSGNDAANAIYKNLGDMQFKDVTSSALPKTQKWTFGVTIVDINNDGFLDIYLCNSGPEQNDDRLRNELYVNNGDFTFSERANQYGLDISSYSVQAAFFDYDNDGDLDVWINNHGNSKDINDLINNSDAKEVSRNGATRLDKVNRIKDNKVIRGKIKLLRRDGDKYTDVSQTAGVSTLAYGLGISIADFNDDGHLDVYVANDFWIPDFYFINDGKGKFVNDKDKINHSSYYSMGVDAADYNNDNILDLAVVDMTPKDHYRNKTLMPSMDVQRFNVLTDVFDFTRQYMFNSFQVGMGDGNFGEIANALEVSLTDWSWAPLIFDIDNDGYNDLYVTNGYLRDSKNQDYRSRQNRLRREMKRKYTLEVAHEELLNCHSQSIDNVIYQNNSSFQYADVTKAASNLAPTFSNGAAYGDLDNDGDLDVVVNNLNEPASILRNNSRSKNYLNVKLEAKNRADILYSKLTVHTKDQIIRRDYSFTRGYLSYMSELASFGVGDATQIERLVIEWPNGTKSTFNDLEVNQTITKNFDSISNFQDDKTSSSKLFTDATNLMEAYKVTHVESFFDDFKEEILLPQKYSDLGPALAITDIDGDGLEDLYIGGSKGYPGRIILMKENKVIEVSSDIMKLHSIYEDIGATFVDVNSDGLPDLYVASGGGGEIKDKNLLQDRLYINTGNGVFKHAKNGIPKLLSSTKSVTPIDIDNDNDMDLFVAGRNTPGQYPQKATSYLLENDNGFYKNITQSILSDQLGNMITDVTAEDINGDGYTDLMIVGEWSTPQVFINDKNKSFNKREDNNLDQLKGWWYSVTKGDFNKDGKMDYIVGNLGTNNKFHASKTKPLKVLYDDFDDNGKLDIVLTKQYNGVEVPVRGKECSSEQMPMLNDKFETFDAFASASVEDILGKKNVKKSKSLEATDFSSKVLLSNGDSFTVNDLPFAAQWAPILDSQVLDINNDGNLDVIIAGNIYNTEPETPSYDASRGAILFGKGNGEFTPLTDITKTGLNLNKNVRNIGILKRQNGAKVLIAANNNYTAQLYVLNK